LRFSFNDSQSSEILFGITTDLDNQAVAGFIKASRRLGSSFKANLEVRTFHNTSAGQALYAFRKDDFVQLSLGWYF
jgi:mitochondrial fission protein ELM1